MKKEWKFMFCAEAVLAFRPEDYVYISAIDYTCENGILENVVVCK